MKNWALETSPVCITLRKGLKAMVQGNLASTSQCVQVFLKNLSTIFLPHTVSFLKWFWCSAEEFSTAKSISKRLKSLWVYKEQRHLLLSQTLDSGSGAAAALSWDTMESCRKVVEMHTTNMSWVFTCITLWEHFSTLENFLLWIPTI